MTSSAFRVWLESEDEMETIIGIGNGPARLGIDLGRVIVGDGGGRTDTSFIGGTDDDAMRTTPIDGAFETIRELFSRFGGRVWIVSKCGPRIEARSRRWLAHWRFHEATGVLESSLRFCRERREKADHARKLGLTHFIDDRQDVLRHLEGVVPHRYLFGPQREPAPAGLAEHVASWADVRERLCR
jgi:hypothetical protein